MKTQLRVFNTLSKEKEVFEPIHEGHVGMYVCGPTVYSDVHLGNCRTFINFDLIYRYLIHLGYKVRYVRNVTDVGHLEGDADTDAEDKISKKARLEKIEPMELVQQYTRGFHEVMKLYNALSPNIEPRATGHIIEQIEMVQTIIDNGYGYVQNGSVYFDTGKLIKDKKGVYGQLSGRKPEELLTETRDNLKKQDEKRNPMDFAIWIKADPSHLMRWNSPWSVGFPGWHLECSTMSTKYLGKTFDIHGGGYDLQFPHHENEIAQNHGACNCSPARYWLHANMLMLNGKKMSKSDGNYVTPEQLITGDSEHLSKGYSPMVVRFFMLQSHYSSTLDMSDRALLSAEKGYRRMMEGNATLQNFQHPGGGQAGALDKELKEMIDLVYDEMNDDFNAPRAMARMFDLVTKINGLKGGQLPFADLLPETLEQLKQAFQTFLFDVLGLRDELEASGGDKGLLDGLMHLIIDMRKEARERKDWSTSDKIRDALKELEVQLKDGKEGTTWSKE